MVLLLCWLGMNGLLQLDIANDNVLLQSALATATQRQQPSSDNVVPVPLPLPLPPPPTSAAVCHGGELPRAMVLSSI